RVVGLDGFIGGVLENPVVEDLAVLIDFNEGSALVGGGAAERFGQVVDVNVNGAGHESGLGADGDGHRTQRVFDRSQRARLGARAGPRRGRILALGQAVNLVVEKQDLDV